MDMDSGLVPKVNTHLSLFDIAGSIMTRVGVNRNRYKISPGLYGIGNPTPDSPVLVTANYKLSFDTVRKELSGINAWLLVLDTHGINVWCAAGKGTFGTQELVKQVEASGLKQIVNHRKLVVPQLGATGISAHQVKKQCEFKVIWGPVRAADIGEFLNHDMKASVGMRRVTFSLPERLVLIPVEIYIGFKPVLLTMFLLFLLSGIGSDFFSFKNAWERGLIGISSLVGGVIAGAVLTPVFLQNLPGRAFSIKGAVAGIVTAIVVVLWYWKDTIWLETIGLMLFVITISSYLAMNFTGSTPFTSPTGVEKEMRKAIPLQAFALIVAAISWIGAGFL
ncbi:MAG: hypothetical protein C0403_05690 [Desulfobacterium sp.]|nr:hypothetical protein [Desulfobacterium sp.]